jgi:lipid II isoglutaminyl synthase (glutamine-hydrolysing)
VVETGEGRRVEAPDARQGDGVGRHAGGVGASAPVARAQKATQSARVHVATTAANVVNDVSRRLGLGSGTVAGGRVALALEPTLVGDLGRSRQVALVSGTNGKTTTTALLAAALAAEGRRVVTNATGANMPAGHAAALAQAARAGNRDGPAVLEVDEGYLPKALSQLAPVAVVLLNLSRDQLDRTNEVRMTAARWRAALVEAASVGCPRVVANCDDPLVAWAAGAVPNVTWVAAGARWLSDAAGCPSCSGRLAFSAGGWSCSCGFSRPTPDVEVVEHAGGTRELARAGGAPLAISLAIPGRFNLANAAMAAVAAEAMGVPTREALEAMARVEEVAGRFAVKTIGGVAVRLLLAKNPAGWAELLDLVRGDRRPIVVGINARVADGRDPSWLWDVAFEELAGRVVVATGDRCRDLSVRLRYAEVPHRTVADPRAALRVAQDLLGAPESADPDGGDGPLDFIGNYTAFGDLWRP